jgi:DNA modification methylase
MHSIIHGDCLEELAKLPLASFDVCLTDPIYGINAGNFSDQGGRMSGNSHDYNDSLENFTEIMPKALKLVSRVLKDRAHIYLACDLRNYPLLRKFLADSSIPGNEWRIPNAPFIQYKVGGGRVPHPGYTPRRSYELWLYAYRGEKQEYKLINDVVECVSDRTESHGAGKPKDLLKTFLSRSCMPGDTVIDFMAGSGSIVPACHELKLKCTAIELEEAYYGRILERIKELK